MSHKEVAMRAQVSCKFHQYPFLGRTVEVNEDIAAKDGVRPFAQAILVIHEIQAAKSPSGATSEEFVSRPIPGFGFASGISVATPSAPVR